MKKILTLMLMATAVFTKAAVPFANPLAARIAEAAMIVPVTDSVAPLSRCEAGEWSGRKVVAVTDINGEIASLGFDLFGNAALPEMPNSLLLQFVERYMLQLQLCLNGHSSIMQSEIDGVTIKPSPTIPAALRPGLPFRVMKEQRRSVKVAVTLPSGEEFSVAFPADCQLITGMNALQLDEHFAKGVSRAEPSTCNVQELLRQGALTRTSSLVKVEGSEYLSDMIRNDMFVVEADSIPPKLYFNVANPARTITNIMLTGDAPVELPTTLIVDKYGGKADTLQVSFGSIIQFIRAEGCTPFFGIKKIDDDMLGGTIFALNVDLGYNHVVSVEFPRAILLGDTSRPILCRAYAYIPLQNVTERFFKQYLSPLPENL